MSDTGYDVFQHYGTAAERAAFTPDPSAAAGVQPLYIWKETDTGTTYIYTTSWEVLSGAGGSIPATVQGDMLYASAANTIAALAKNTTATRYLSNTGGSNNPAWAQITLTNGVTGVLPAANMSTEQTLLTADPGAPTNDTWWVVRTGASPTMTVALKARIAGATYTIASITI